MISRKNKFLVILAGPTASGKTACGIELARHFNTEIISADSRQIYRETNIGTAVPSPEELSAVNHHFIKCISLGDYYNASMYEFDVLERLDSLFEKHEIVLMVGGSGLYINAVTFGIDMLPNVDVKLRKQMAQELKEKGLKHMQEKLKRLDPISYQQVDLNNHFRVLKALEVSVQTGRPYSSFLTRKKRERDFGIIRLALDMNRQDLYDRINQRVVDMVDRGLVEEVRGLEPFREKNAMKTVGYREMFRHLDGELSLEQVIDMIQRNTRKYARKQLTWFRKDNLFPWFHPTETEKMIHYIEEKIRD